MNPGRRLNSSKLPIHNNALIGMQMYICCSRTWVGMKERACQRSRVPALEQEEKAKRRPPLGVPQSKPPRSARGRAFRQAVCTGVPAMLCATMLYRHVCGWFCICTA